MNKRELTRAALFASSHTGNTQLRSESSCAFCCVLPARVRTFVLALMITALTVMASPFVMEAGAAHAYISEDKTTAVVADFDELKKAVEGSDGYANVEQIIIDPQAAVDFADKKDANIEYGDGAFYIPIEQPIRISREVTITTAEDVQVILARSAKGGNGDYDSKDFSGANEEWPAFFNLITPRAGLTIEGNITMSGDVVAADFNEEKASFTFDVEEKEWSRGNGTGIVDGGFFVHSSNGGSVVINGASNSDEKATENVVFTNFVTDTTVINAAPIYVGGGSTLEMNGGSITGNDVGFSDEEANTAGAIMIKDKETSAELNDGEIAGNRGYAGDILADEESVVNVSDKFIVADNTSFEKKDAEASDNTEDAKATEATEETTEATTKETEATEATEATKQEETEATEATEATEPTEGTDGEKTAEEQKEDVPTIISAPKLLIKGLFSAPKLMSGSTTSNTVPANLLDRNGVPYIVDSNGNNVAYVDNTVKLKAALADSFFPVIDINSNLNGFQGLALTEPLTVNRKVQIRSTRTGGIKIGRGTERDVKVDNKKGYLDGTNGTTATYTKNINYTASSTSPALFNVTSSGDLTIANGVTLTGQEVIAQYYPADPGYTKATAGPKTWRLSTPKPKTNTLSQLNWTTFVIGDGGNPQKYLAATSDLTAHERKKLEFVNASDVLKADGTIASNAKWTVRDYKALTEEKGTIGGWALINDDGYLMGSQVSSGSGWRAVNTRYVQHGSWTDGWWNTEGSTKYKKAEYTGRVSYYGWNSIFSNYENRTIDYLNVYSGDGGTNYITGSGFYNGNNVSTQRALNFYNINELQFKADPDPNDDGIERAAQTQHFNYIFNDKTWTTADLALTNADASSYYGYFIQNTGGIVTINNGAKLTNLTTANDVSRVAPVVVKGDSNSSTEDNGRKNFVMNGGSIEGNKVGYIGDTLDSTAPVKTIANAIKGSNGTGLGNMTNTAGGVIFTDKATAKIAGGDIKGNKGDAGGIIVTEEAHVKFTSGKINSNIGVHHAGAAHVEHGGTLVMDGANAEMKNNIAWYKGGAVWATEWGTSGYAVADWSMWPKDFPKLTTVTKKSDKGGGNFVLKNGTIQNNTAFARAGAIEVESNGVELNGGLIDSNYCRSLGGAIYIEGDSPNYSYSLVLPKGHITDNTAVFKTPNTGNEYKDENALLDRKIGTELDTTTGSWLVTNDSPGDNSDRDFNGAMGNGGGIWLCPVGGTSVFTGGDIYIWGNDAERNKGGEDFYLHKGNGAAMLQSTNLQGSWKNEVTKAFVDKDMGVVSGPLSMQNTTDYDDSDYEENPVGVVITNNIARDGGAIACNGTFIIGQPKDVHRFNAKLDMTKTWQVDPAGKTINLKLQYKGTDGQWKDLTYTSAEPDETSAEGEPKTGVYEVDLNGTNDRDEIVEGSDEDDALALSDVISETTPISSNVWRASAFIPLYVMEGSQKVFLYTLKNPAKSNYNGETVDFSTIDELDLTNEAHVGHLYKYIEAKKAADEAPTIQVANWNIQIVETVKVGNKTYDCEIAYPKTGEGSGYADDPITLNNPVEGVQISTFQITYSTVSFGANLVNSLQSVDIELNKKDNYGSGISGAQFVLVEAHREENEDNGYYRVAGDENAPTSTEHQKTYEDFAVSTATSSGTDGALKLNGVRQGHTYFLFEKSNPNSNKYKNHTAPWLIKVASDGSFTVHYIDEDHRNKVQRGIGANSYTQDYTAKKAWSRYWNEDWFTQNPATSATTIVNDWKPISYELSKKGWNNGKLYGATFKVYETNKTSTNLIPTGEPTIYTVTDTSGKFTLRNLEPSKAYLMFETVAPAGYKKPVDPWFIMVDANGNVKVRTLLPAKKNMHWNSKTKKNVTSDEGTDHTIDLVGSGKEWPHVNDWVNYNSDLGSTIPNEVATIKIKKTSGDETTPLGGVRFAFGDVAYTDNNSKYYAGKNSLIKNGNDLVIATSTNQGEIDLTPVIKALNPDANSGKVGQGKNLNADEINILMYELEAASIHEIKTTPWLITIKNNGDITIQEHENTKVWNTTPVDETNKCLKENSITSEVGKFTEISTGTIAAADAVVKNEPIEYKVDKVDLDDETVAVNGAEFNLYKVDDTTTNVGTDNLPHGSFKISNATPVNGDTPIRSENGKVILPITGQGAYMLFETKAPDGYKRAQLPWGIYVNSNNKLSGWKIKDDSKDTVLGLVTNAADGSIKTPVTDIEISCEYFVGETKIRNEKLDIKLTKTDTEGNPLQGAVFELYEVDAEQVASKTTAELLNGDWTTLYGADAWDVKKSDTRVGEDETISSNAQGEVSLPITKAGLYMLFETTAVTGYKRPVDPWIIYVTDYGKVVVRKSSDDNAKHGERWWRAYKYQIVSNGNLVNEKKPIELYKVDETDDANRLGGAEFVICEAQADGNGNYCAKNAREGSGWKDTATVMSTAITGTDGSAKVYTSSSDTATLGRIVIDDLAAGEYFLFETRAPKGFVRSTSPWFISVKDSTSGRTVTVKRIKPDHQGDVTVQGTLKNISPDTPASEQSVKRSWWTLGVEENQGWFQTITGTTLQLVNEPKYVTKVSRTDTSTLLKDVEFDLYPAYTQEWNRTTIVRRGDEKIGDTLKSDDKGRIYLPSSITREESKKTALTGDMAGVYSEGYMLVETKAASGYQRRDIPWWIKVDANGNLTVTTASVNKRGDSRGGIPYWNTDDFNVNCFDSGKNVNLLKNDLGDLKLTKVDKYDHNKKLAGAQFTFFNAAYEEIGSDVYKYTKSGEAIATSSPTDSNGQFALPANIDLTYITTQKPKLLIMEETKAPEGYSVSPNPWLVGIYKNEYYANKYYLKAWPLTKRGTSTTEYVIKSNCDYSTLIENSPSVNLKKVDASTVTFCQCGEGNTKVEPKGEGSNTPTAYLDGVQFELYDANDDWTKKTNTARATITSKNGGLVEMGDLPDGKYLLYEKSNPNSQYIVETKPWKITVESRNITNLILPDGNVSLDQVYITNSKIYELPSAGGMGTYWFMMFGAMMMAFAAALPLAMRSRRFGKIN